MSSTADQAQEVVRDALRRFEELVVSEQPPSEVLRSMAQTLHQAVDGLGVVALMPADQRGESFAAVARSGHGAALALEPDGKPRAEVLAAVRSAVTRGKPVAVSPGQTEFAGSELQRATQFYVPIDAVGRVMGAVLVICGGDLDPKVYRQYISFCQQGARAAGMYLTRRQSEVLQEDAAGQQGMLRIMHRLLGVDRPRELVHELANQARPHLGAQRIAAVGYAGRGTELAFSDAVDTNRKAVLVRAVEMLADGVRQRQVPMSFTRGQELEEEDEALAPLLEDVWELGSAEGLCLTPIRNRDEIVGVVVGEYATAGEAGRRSSAQQELSQQVGPVLARAVEWDRRPLRRTSRMLAAVRDRPRGFVVRAAVAASILATVVWALFFVPVPIHVRGDARLEPAYKAVIASPLAGRVERVEARTGQVVTAGSLLAKLDDSDLRMQLLEVSKAIEGHRVQRDVAERDRNRAEVRAAELEIERWQVRREQIEREIERTDVRSLIDGVVLTERPQRLAGRSVPHGDPLFQVADLRRFELVMEVREEDLALVEGALRAGRPVEATFLSHAWPDQPQRATVTQITAISPTSSPDEHGRQHVFKITVPVELEGLSAQLVLANPTGRAKLETGEGSVAYRYGRRIWRFLQMTILF